MSFGVIAGCSSAWIERLVWDQEAAGSNPVTPIVACICRQQWSMVRIWRLQTTAYLNRFGRFRLPHIVLFDEIPYSFGCTAVCELKGKVSYFFSPCGKGVIGRRKAFCYRFFEVIL